MATKELDNLTLLNNLSKLKGWELRTNGIIVNDLYTSMAHLPSDIDYSVLTNLKKSDQPMKIPDMTAWNEQAVTMMFDTSLLTEILSIGKHARFVKIKARHGGAPCDISMYATEDKDSLFVKTLMSQRVKVDWEDGDEQMDDRSCVWIETFDEECDRVITTCKSCQMKYDESLIAMPHYCPNCGRKIKRMSA